MVIVPVEASQYGEAVDARHIAPAHAGIARAVATIVRPPPMVEGEVIGVSSPQSAGAVHIQVAQASDQQEAAVVDTRNLPRAVGVVVSQRYSEAGVVAADRDAIELV